MIAVDSPYVLAPLAPGGPGVEFYDEAYYYGKAYRDYDRQNPERKLAFYRDVVETAAAHREKPRVLDIGCAFGELLGRLPARFERVGIDVSSYALGQARTKVPGASFVQAELPPETLGHFDVITAFDVIEHVPDLAAILHRVDTMLAPGGEFVFVVPVYDGPLGWLVHLLDYDPTHVNKLGRRAWLRLAAESFDVVEWRGIYRYLFPRYYAHVPTSALRGSAPAILVRARKRSAATATEAA